MSKIPNEFTVGDPKKKKKAIKDWVRQNIPWNEKWEELNVGFPNSDESDSD